MAAPTERRSARRLFWPTFGLVTFLIFWLVLCTAGFWYLFQQIAPGSRDPDVALHALQWMTWPYTVLCIAGPFFVVLSIGGLRVVRDLLELQKLIGGMPALFQSMQTTVDEFRTLRSQLITDVSRVNDASTDGTEGPDEPSPAASAPHLREFFDLYEQAKALFYRALEDFNTRGEEPLIVQRGGSNFVDIATQLRDRHEFAKSDDLNKRVANFVIKAFELERPSRRHRSFLTADMVGELRSLRAQLRS